MSAWSTALPTVCFLFLASCCAGLPTELEPLAPAVCREPPLALAAMPLPSAGPLFTLVESPVLDAGQERLLGVIRARPTTARVHVARLAGGAGSLLQAGREITFPVSPERSFTAVGRQVTRRAPDDVSWSGRITGEHGEVTLVLTARGVTGSLHSMPPGGGSTLYAFEPIGGGLQAVVCADPGRLPPD